MMPGLIPVQPAISVQDQINNLRSLGLMFEDEQAAEHLLHDISYFRLIKGYSIGLKDANGLYLSGITFEHIVSLYKFNALFRQSIFNAIERAEVNLRCRVADHFSNLYGAMGYIDSANFQDPTYHTAMMNMIQTETQKHSREPFIRHFQSRYIDGNIPLYAVIEIFSFGMLSKFFKNMKISDKKAVAAGYNIAHVYLESWFEFLAYIRNICAHYGRLYNIKLSKMPKLFKQAIQAGVKNDKIFCALWCLKMLIPHDDYWQRYCEMLDKILKAHPQVRHDAMGLPRDWKKLIASL